ncbi:hypothetical protein [Paremcibacter congregatus]|uniref:Uncharacterized protein n=1 Tax=Paremcibacter congregatus TaxID=2043170 RepID=A0A2G4YSY6_9PROT|nr:hypothetical protein [Paremcibacter congregatus]PHZ85448.1 hypothetical protein CRD36_06750 [Paremcibacter congregatus]QDE27263.1 hypothetical protein FIV45_08185 [Paremcibacter congregatus]
MTLDPTILTCNEKLLRRAARRDVRFDNQLVVWAKIKHLWEMYDFSIGQWPAYLEASYFYGCMLMREGVQDVRIGLFPHADKIPQSPPFDQSPAFLMGIGIFRPSYTRTKGF